MPLLGGNITVSGIYVGSRENFEALTAFLAKHPLKPVIDKVIDFKDAPAAYQHMEKESFLGKIVIANF
jgi:D-arabinose 1-dehydrogenase-like Zn-dependent alcohol dehydrogenase